jgi:hypothetical protein
MRSGAHWTHGLHRALLAEQYERVTPFAWAQFHACRWGVGEGSWLPVGAWQACRDDCVVADGSEVVLGVDIGGSRAASAVVAVQTVADGDGSGGTGGAGCADDTGRPAADSSGETGRGDGRCRSTANIAPGRGRRGLPRERQRPGDRPTPSGGWPSASPSGRWPSIPGAGSPRRCRSNRRHRPDGRVPAIARPHGPGQRASRVGDHRGPPTSPRTPGPRPPRRDGRRQALGPWRLDKLGRAIRSRRVHRVVHGRGKGRACPGAGQGFGLAVRARRTIAREMGGSQFRGRPPCASAFRCASSITGANRLRHRRTVRIETLITSATSSGNFRWRADSARRPGATGARRR